MKVHIFLLAVAMILFNTISYASKFEIIFHEGEYSFNKQLSETSTENKYLAKVVIKKDGIVLNKNETIKGSTIPDSWFFYEVWYGSGNITPPNDEDIEKIFTEWESKIPDSNDFNFIDSDLYEFIGNIGEIIKKASYIPVIYSGTYGFEIGLHKNGQSITGLGLLYVPRLKGATIDNPYDGRSPEKTTNTYDGGYIVTINKNVNRDSQKLANGINVHDGRHDKYYIGNPSVKKFSIGCLTIHPDNWMQFYKLLPNIETWKKEGHTGKVTIIRNKPASDSITNFQIN